MEGKSLLLASFKCWGWVFTCPNMVAVACISEVQDTWSVSSVVVENQGSTAQIWSNHCWTPVGGIVHWAQCQNILLMTFFQLLVVCDLLSDSMWCMHGVSNLACRSSGCVTASSNLRQQHPSTPHPPQSIYNHVLFNKPFSLSHGFMEANVLWFWTCQSWKCPWCNCWAALPFPCASLDAENICHFMPVILRHARCGTFYWFTM